MTTQLVRRVAHVMGMPISLATRGRHADDAAAQDAWKTVIELLQHTDRMFSGYRSTSELSRIRRGELEIADASPDMAEVLTIGETARAASGGAFNMWGSGPGVTAGLDTDGVVKGWAVERAAQQLYALDETDFCLAAGGDMVCHTADPGAPGWHIGIEDPHRPTSLVARVSLTRGAVATSGSAHRGAHIRDARTGRPACTFASISVIGASLTQVDIEATTAIALGPEGPTWLARKGATSVIVDRAGHVTTTSPDSEKVPA